MTSRLTTTKLVDRVQLDTPTTAQIVRGPQIPDMPTRVVVITMSGGGSLQMEGVFDTPSFQVRTRGAHNQYGDAEEIAWDLDDYFLFQLSNTEIDTVWVTHFSRAGGAPSQDAPGQFVCTYIAHSSTGVS